MLVAAAAKQPTARNALAWRMGSTLGGLLDCIGILTSVALRYGVPLEPLVNKLSHVRFESSGLTKNRQIPQAKSIVDYIFRWMGIVFREAEGTPDIAETQKQVGDD